MMITASGRVVRGAMLALVSMALSACADLAGPTPPFSFTAVSAGGSHSCALSKDGGVYCWGRGENGELGDGEVRSRSAPVRVRGDEHYVAVSIGENHSCGLTADGGGRCWGWNVHGQLGTGSTIGVGGPRDVAGGIVFESISAGGLHTCGVTPDGVGYCWGLNGSGQLGDGGREKRLAPVRVAGDLRFGSIDAGWMHTCATTVDGAAYCWGANHQGQLGNNATTDRLTPTRVKTSRRFTAISAGTEHTCAIAENGDAYCWGSNRYGELGNGYISRPRRPGALVPGRVHGSPTYRQLEAGNHYTCGIKRGNRMVCWGRGLYGQLGTGFHAPVATPRTVAPKPAGKYKEFLTVSTGGTHTCGVASERTLYCWGAGEYGQLGAGATTEAPLPVRVKRARND